MFHLTLYGEMQYHDLQIYGLIHIFASNHENHQGCHTKKFP